MIRGINVGGSKRVSMGDLRALFEALGAEDVRTYVQSGNVVFRSAGKSPATLAKAIEDQVGEVLDLDVRVVVRTGKELAEIVGKNPFLEDGKDPATLHVTFLEKKPSAIRTRDLPAAGGRPDEFRLAGREVYLRCPNGY